MSIRVTCPSCHTRFNVSDKFAGKEGPCPKCKKLIRVPELTEQVVIKEKEVGPKDSKGRSILKPITRQETNVSSVQLTLIIAGIVTFFVMALVIRFLIEDKAAFPLWLTILSALAIAPATAFGAYAFLRNQETGAIEQSELIKRIAGCSVAYALLWGAMPLAAYAFNGHYEMGSWMIALIAMLGLGGATGMLGLEFDYLFGLIHYGSYLVVCLIGRVIAGLGLLPGINEASEPAKPQVAPSLVDAWQNFDLNCGFELIAQASQFAMAYVS